MAWLLDASALIAMFDEAHERHLDTATWISQAGAIATCPITEGALVRYLVRLGQPVTVPLQLLADLHSQPNHEFWPDTLSYCETALGQVIGHRQVTDAYLVSLVRHHGPDARLATLDQGLTATYPDAAVTLTNT